MKKKIIALVAARKGSKGVKNKNLLKFKNKNIVNLAVSLGLKIKLIDKVILSSDSNRILDSVKMNTKLIKIKRPLSLARDNSPMLPVIRHAISVFEKRYNEKISSIVILDPTSILRLKNDVTEAIKIFKKKRLDLLVSTHEAEHNPYFSILEKQGRHFSLSKGINLNIGSRQGAKKVYNINTVVWIYSRNAIMLEKRRIPKKTGIINVPLDRTLEINTKKDLIEIKKILKNEQKI